MIFSNFQYTAVYMFTWNIFQVSKHVMLYQFGYIKCQVYTDWSFCHDLNTVDSFIHIGTNFQRPRKYYGFFYSVTWFLIVLSSSSNKVYEIFAMSLIHVHNLWITYNFSIGLIWLFWGFLFLEVKMVNFPIWQTHFKHVEHTSLIKQG